MAIPENHRYKPVQEILTIARPDDWQKILETAVTALTSYIEDSSNTSLLDYLDSNPDIDELLSTTDLDKLLGKPGSNLPLDSHGEPQSILAFLRNSLTTPDEKQAQKDDFNKSFPQILE